MILTIEESIALRQRSHNLGMKYNITNPNSKELMLKLLRLHPATLETLSFYIKRNKSSTRQYITLLRNDGYYITLQGVGGFYELHKINCKMCKKKFETTKGLRIHHTTRHGVKN